MVAEAMMKKEIHGEWLEKVDNLFTALEIYRDVENQAVERIQAILAEKGISISPAEIRISDAESIRERLKQTREARLHEEQLRIKREEKKREEEHLCRR
ncbi:MAG: hypothetical protein K2K56_08105 [Lachnospiraceae bacterium]|nr:hypothetical protein [Lachnospiraceae bacterium]